MDMLSQRPSLAVRAWWRSLSLEQNIFPKPQNATIFLVFIPWGAKTEKGTQEKNRTGKKRLWWDDSQWQIVCLPTLESLIVPTTLKLYHSSAVNKHLWNQGWFKQEITAAVGVCLSVIFSDTQVRKRSACDGLCGCPFSDGIFAL